MNVLIYNGLNVAKSALSYLAPRGFYSSSATAAVSRINDMKQSDKDYVERCKLAATYRLVDVKGWDWNIYNHITLRSESDPEHFFINPFGLFYSEITASSLLKIDSNCNVIERGSTTYGLNKAGFVLHSTIHSARKDINAIIHVHTGLAAGLSTLKCGFLPISQEALICGEVSYHDYAGIFVDDEMRERIKKDLGPKNKIMILRNHGVVACGTTIEEAWFYFFTFMFAASIQLNALAAANGVENLIVPPKHVLDQVQRVVKAADGVNEKRSDGVEWRLGEMEFEAEMRKLDLMGYNTGYPFKKAPFKI